MSSSAIPELNKGIREVYNFTELNGWSTHYPWPISTSIIIRLKYYHC